uniref:Mitochondrial thiamine pyrophosphate carrier n=1 Tax=Periophthalmus magnuspinnatus TaxID=409849 RepID=A0A3B4B1P8_9GOBI
MVGYDPRVKDAALSPEEAALAGSAAGMVTRALISPFDVIKIRFQLQIERVSSQKPEGKYSGIFQACRCIYREEGLSAFWKGHIPAQLLSVAFGAVQFTSFEFLTEVVHKTTSYDSQTAGVHFVCGGLAACSATVFCQPLDTLRTRFAAQGEPKIYRNLRHAVFTMCRSEGALTFYRGLSPTLMAVFPYAGLQFFFYNVFKKMLAPVPNARNSGGQWRSSLSIYGIAGTYMRFKCYIYVVFFRKPAKSVFSRRDYRWGQVRTYKGLLDCAAQIAKEEGLQGFFKGLSPSLLKAALSTGFTFFWYEFFLDLMRDHKERRINGFLQNPKQR